MEIGPGSVRHQAGLATHGRASIAARVTLLRTLLLSWRTCHCWVSGLGRAGEPAGVRCAVAGQSCQFGCPRQHGCPPPDFQVKSPTEGFCMMINHKKAPAVSVSAEICRGCDMCVLACSLYHTGQCRPSLARLHVTKDLDAYRFTIRICQQCDDPACMGACPVEGAMERDEVGVVSIIGENCIACGSCMEACPHDAIGYHQGLDMYLKCDLCRGRGDGPMCVEVCPTGALLYEAAGGEEE